ncbi:hypothetical protein E2562_031767 [Oryza meyeriana var. granulata]|uniref:Uncharacterized protein n=1 Tax=Oryza meyeriana var. granulata TaxID=110450 RepID=A0A6G1CTX0_9ORYZ|nr:hypothetical protein E2562_031767 [Oryza meyeriana var. granulata]
MRHIARGSEQPLLRIAIERATVAAVDSASVEAHQRFRTTKGIFWYRQEGRNLAAHPYMHAVLRL